MMSCANRYTGPLTDWSAATLPLSTERPPQISNDGSRQPHGRLQHMEGFRLSGRGGYSC